jgi:hypothetical protein
MRHSGIGILLLLLAGTAAGEEDPCLKKVFTLLEKSKDASVSWDERYEAYKEAKAALKKRADAATEAKTAAKGGDAASQAAFEAAEAAHKACKADYEVIRTDVANALRRDAVPASGWIMGIFGACLLWGGFTVCCLIAIRSGRSGTEED